MTFNYFSKPKPRVFAHRGCSTHFPENTIASFEVASKFTNYFELDIWFTTDSKIIVHHDDTFMRTCGVDSASNSLAYSEVKKLNAGRNFKVKDSHPYLANPIEIPTLETVITRFPDCFFNIEVKSLKNGSAKQVIDLLQSTEATEKTLLAAESDEIMAEIRSVKPEEIPTSMCHSDGYEFLGWIQSGCKTDYKPKAAAAQIPVKFGAIQLAKPEIVDAAHLAGLEVHYWTINNELLMKDLLGMNADGIMTDDPALGRKVVSEFSSTEVK